MGYGSGSRSGGVKPEPPNLAVKQRRKGWNVKVFILQRDYNAWLRALYGEYHRRPFCTRKRFGLASTSKVCVEWGGRGLRVLQAFPGIQVLWSCGSWGFGFGPRRWARGWGQARVRDIGLRAVGYPPAKSVWHIET